LFEENSKGWHRGLPIRVASSPPADSGVVLSWFQAFHKEGEENRENEASFLDIVANKCL
jgi:hypothetical protein